jgi:hypothetical protein
MRKTDFGAAGTKMSNEGIGEASVKRVLWKGRGMGKLKTNHKMIPETPMKLQIASEPREWSAVSLP